MSKCGVLSVMGVPNEDVGGAEDVRRSDSVLRSRFLKTIIVKRLQHYPRALSAVLYAYSVLPDVARLHDVAAHSGMNPTSFSRFFTEKIGTSFTRVMKVLRIELAVEALERKECSVESLACLSGYESACSFTRVFKEIMGVTPSEYRRTFLADRQSHGSLLRFESAAI